MRMLVLATFVALLGLSGRSEAQWSDNVPEQTNGGKTATPVGLPLNNISADYINQFGTGNPIVGGSLTFQNIQPAPGGYVYSKNAGTVNVNNGGGAVTFTRGSFSSAPALPSGSTFVVVWTVFLEMGGTVTYVVTCTVK